MNKVEGQTKRVSKKGGRDLVRDLYEPRIRVARVGFAMNPVMSTMLTPDADPVMFELFLIHFSALGAAMTKPIEDWLQKAGERCEHIGLTELGHSLRLHSKQEANRYLMFTEDTRALVARWNAREAFSLNADLILAQPITDGVRRYCKLHEDIIAGDAPFRQLAIGYEIERLSVCFGSQFIRQCMRVLGSTDMMGLSFLQERISLDVSHTYFNQQQLNRLFDQHPEYVMPMVSAGESALDAYAMFLKDCLNLARTYKAALTLLTSTPSKTA